MEKNQIVEAVAENLGTGGEGVAHVDGSVLFVPYLLKGERAKIKILKAKGGIAYGKAEEIITPSADRVLPRCQAFYRCGGCQLQHMKYTAQLDYKRELVQSTLKKIGGIDFEVSPCTGSDEIWGYRNKLQLPIGRQRGKNVIGFYAERSHAIIPVSECPIHPDWAKGLISALYAFMEQTGLQGYDETDKSGQLRHVVVRELKGKFIVTLVTTVKKLKGKEVLIGLLDGIFPEYTLLFNYNPKDTNVVFGEEFTVIKGTGSYECEDLGILFEAGAETFVQVNENIRGKLYEEAVSLAVERGDEVVIDCYAGGGLMTAMFAKRCRHAYGIEIVPEASRCADALREKNGLTEKMTNICGKVEEHIGEVLEREGDATVVLDPPRAGVHRSVLNALMRKGIKKIVMISCNPATLARDVGILTGALTENEKGELVKRSWEENGGSDTSGEGSYELTLVHPFDMFPHTKHVETLVVLSHKKPDSHIEVKIDFDNTSLDKSAIAERAEKRKPKDKPTYKDIQD